MKHGSLFNGIGGFQLAAEWMNWDNIFSCEIDDFCNRVTKYHFPNCKQYHDIKETDFKRYKGQIDILTGGFPCQPFSVAGKQLGTGDERSLWHEMHRAVKEIQPRWVVAENVLGIVSWNGGMVFEQVHTDLENEGYEVQAFIIPAASVNAPHRRERVWFVANANSTTKQRECECEQREKESYRRNSTINKTNWQNFPTQPPICGGDDGLPKELDSLTFPKWRSESIKAYGNAIVPQVAFQIFKAIQNYETNT